MAKFVIKKKPPVEPEQEILIEGKPASEYQGYEGPIAEVTDILIDGVSMKGKEGTAFITKLEKTEQGNQIVAPIQTEKPFAPAIFKGAHATVGADASQTIPVGKWASVKVGVFLSMPCDPDMASVEAMFEQVSTWVGEKLSEMVEGVAAAYGIGTEN